MEISDNLALVAELAIGLAGFAGLAAVVGRRGRDNPQLDASRLRGALEFSFLVTGFALLPNLLREAGIASPMIWRSCCLTFAISGAGFTIFKVLSVLSLRSVPGVSFSSTWHLFWVSLSALAVVTLAIATLNLVPPTFAYLLGLYVYLTLAALIFLRLVLSLLNASS